MAKKIVEQLVDDIDGGVLESGEGETIHFSLDGVAYEIDLSTANAAALRDLVSPYTKAGRRVAASRPGSAPRRRSSTRPVGETATIREWAAANGFTVADRGRIPEDVEAAYRAAN